MAGVTKLALPRSRSGAGFTLLEMLAVVAILGLLGALVLTRGPGRSAGLEVRLAAGTVAQTFRLARARAMASNAPEGVVFDSESSIMVGKDGVAHQLPAGLSVTVTDTAAQVAGRLGTIVFFPDGSSNGGRVELGGRGQHSIVAVNWLTGEVSVLRGPRLE